MKEKNEKRHFRVPVLTDYGRPMKPFFIEIPKFWGWGRQIGQINFGAFGVFSADLSAPILVSMFPNINHYFYKKLSLYIQITNTFLGLGFEFWAAKNLGFSHYMSAVRACT